MVFMDGLGFFLTARAHLPLDTAWPLCLDGDDGSAIAHL